MNTETIFRLTTFSTLLIGPGISIYFRLKAGRETLRSLFSPITFGILFAAVARIMVFIYLDELLLTAREYDTGHMAIFGMVAGMAISLLLFL